VNPRFALLTDAIAACSTLHSYILHVSLLDPVLILYSSCTDLLVVRAFSLAMYSIREMTRLITPIEIDGLALPVVPTRIEGSSLNVERGTPK